MAGGLLSFRGGVENDILLSPRRGAAGSEYPTAGFGRRSMAPAPPPRPAPAAARKPPLTGMPALCDQVESTHTTAPAVPRRPCPRWRAGGAGGGRDAPGKGHGMIICRTP